MTSNIAENINFELRFDDRVFVEALSKIFNNSISELGPREKLTVSQWAEKYRWIGADGSTSNQNEKWHNDVIPYVTYIMDQYNNPRCYEIIVRAAAQVGKTEIILNMLGYIFHLNPGSVLFVMPSKEAAVNDFVTPRLMPMVRATPALREIFPMNNRKFKHTEVMKQFRGGYIRFTGTDPNELASRPQRDLFIDEFSKIVQQDKAQGSTLKNAQKRQANFFNRKTILTSTPLLEDECEVSKKYDDGKRHIREHYCPHCGGEIFWDIGYLRYNENNPIGSAWYECLHCEKRIEEEHKRSMVKAATWLDLDPDKSQYSMAFQLSAFDSPWVSFGEIAQEYEEAKKDPEEKMQNFYNNFLGLPYSRETVRLEKTAFEKRQEEYRAGIPRGVLALTAGVDINTTDITASLWGWGPGDGALEEGWLIEYKIFPGDPEEEAPWRALEEWIFRRRRHEDGYLMSIDATAVDTGFKTDRAEDFCVKWFGHGVYAVQGFPERSRKIVDRPYFRNKSKGNKRRKTPLIPVGDFQAKWAIYSRLRISEPGAGFLHFPRDPEGKRGVDEKYFKELVVEKIETNIRGAQIIHSFVRPRKKRNEAIDTLKYAFAIMKFRNFDFTARFEEAESQARKITEYERQGISYEKIVEEKREQLVEILKNKLREKLARQQNGRY